MGGFSYPDQFNFEVDLMPEATGASVLGVFLVVYLLVWLAIFAFSVVCYVLNSLGLYTIANRRGIRHSWLAWVPIGNVWILGSISDQYQYVAKGRVKNRRKLLLGLNMLWIVLEVGCVMGIIAMYIIPGLILATLGIFIGLFTIVVTIILSVYQYIAYYDLFRSSEPNNAVLFLVLSIVIAIFFPAIIPILVFACRKKDLGMPPRRQPAPQQVVVPTVEPIVDSNVVETVVVPTVEPVAEGFAQPEEFEEE